MGSGNRAAATTTTTTAAIDYVEGLDIVVDPSRQVCVVLLGALYLCPTVLATAACNSCVDVWFCYPGWDRSLLVALYPLDLLSTNNHNNTWEIDTHTLIGELPSS